MSVRILILEKIILFACCNQQYTYKTLIKFAEHFLLTLRNF